MNRILWMIAALCGLAGAVLGQEPEPKPKGRHVRFLAVGDHPPFRQEVRDGVRYELPPPVGSIPPVEIQITPVDDKGTEKPDSASVRVQLGKVTDRLPVPEGPGTLVIRSTKAGGEPWLRITRPESGDFLVVIWRETRAKTWDTAKAMAIPDTHPPGKLTLLNVAPVAAAIVCDSEKLLLAPAKPLNRNLAGKAIEFHIGTPTTDGTFKKMISMSLEQRPAEHTLAVLCLSDGLEPRQPLKLTLLKSRGLP